jgi:hypothetical protein
MNMNSKQTNNTWIIENEKIIKKLQKTKMVQHHIASNNEKQEPRINHQAIRRSFLQVPTCLVLCFVLLVFKLFRLSGKERRVEKAMHFGFFFCFLIIFGVDKVSTNCTNLDEVGWGIFLML